MEPEVKGTKYWVEKALKSAGSTKLDVMGFIKATGFPIDTEVANKFYVQLRHNDYIYLGEYEIEFFGYKGPLKKQKDKIMDMLNSEPYASEKGTSWHVYDNEKYSEFFESIVSKSNRTTYPPIQTGRGHGKDLHVLISPRIYKHLCMKADTTRGYQIIDYMVKVEELVATMLDYVRVLGIHENKVAVKKKDSEISDLKLMIINMEQKVEERFQKAEEERKRAKEERKRAEEERKRAEEERKRAEEERKRAEEERKRAEEERKRAEERFNELIGIPKDRYNHLVILKDDDAEDDDPPYYILRTQEKSINSRIKTLKKTWNVR